MKPRKYRNTPTVIDGITFASKREAARYAELRLLERAGEIRNLELQPRFDIIVNGAPVKYPSGRAMRWKGDFAYFANDERVVEDVKGIDTRGSKMLRALVEHIYRLKVEVIS